jgi:Flp pilus assembly protein TadB
MDKTCLITVLTALLTPVIALLGILIAYQQWRTSRNKLKFDLFERRFAVYDAAVQLINFVLEAGKITPDAMREFVKEDPQREFYCRPGDHDVSR